MRKNILITGLPRSGKSTLLKAIILDFPNKVGFITNEIRENGERTGFEIETHQGEKALLASINIKSTYKVSRYFVDVQALDNILKQTMCFHQEDLLFLDEIGQMELYSEKFKQLTLKFLDSQNICIATLTRVYSDNFIELIKNRRDVIIIEINENNRESKQRFLKDLIKKIMKAKRYLNEPERFSFAGDKILIKSEHGNREISNYKGKFKCNCDFFKENEICSHVLASEELIGNSKINV